MQVSYSVDEIEQDITRWYFKQKKKIPAIDKEYLEAYRKQEAEEHAARPLWTGPDSLNTMAVAQGTFIPEKPEFGTPAFWKDYWVKRKAKEKAAAEAGEVVVEKPKKPKKKVTKKKEESPST
jgi:hypothetical protein